MVTTRRSRPDAAPAYSFPLAPKRPVRKQAATCAHSEPFFEPPELDDAKSDDRSHSPAPSASHDSPVPAAQPAEDRPPSPKTRQQRRQAAQHSQTVSRQPSTAGALAAAAGDAQACDAQVSITLGPVSAKQDAKRPRTASMSHACMAPQQAAASVATEAAAERAERARRTECDRAENGSQPYAILQHLRY